MAKSKNTTDPKSTNRQPWEPAGVISHIPKIFDHKEKDNQDKGGSLNLELSDFSNQKNIKDKKI